MSEKKFEKVEANVAEGNYPPEPAELASRLVKDGVLTAFQARQILKGAQQLGLENKVIWTCATPCNTDFLASSLGPQWIFRYGMIIGLLALVVVTTALDSSFLQTNNMLNLLRQWAPPGLMAVGMTFVIISGGFDLSVGGTYAAAAVLSAALALVMPIPAAVALAVLMGGGIGLVNGVVITRLEVNPFVATLGMGFIVTGLTEVISNAHPIMVEDPAFQILGGGDILGIPIPGILLIIALLVGGVVLARSVYGRYVYADLCEGHWKLVVVAFGIVNNDPTVLAAKFRFSGEMH